MAVPFGLRSGNGNALTGIGAPIRAAVGPSATTPATPSYVGGTPAGSTGTVGNFGINNPWSAVQGQSGALGNTPYQANNPWANNLVSNMTIPVNPNDPSANLFRNMANNGSTPSSGMPSMGGAGPAARPGTGMPPSMNPGSSPAGAPPGMPTSPPPGMPPMGGGLGQMGGQMPPWMHGGAGFSANPGGFGRPNVGFGGSGVAQPSPLVAAGNPTSPMFNSPMGNPQQMQHPQQQQPQMTPQMIQQIMASLSGGMGGGTGGGAPMPMMADGGKFYYDTGGPSDAASAITQDNPASSPMARIAALQAQAARAAQNGQDPMSNSALLNPQHDPIMSSLLNANHATGYGDNSVQQLLQRLGLRPGVVRTGSGMPSGMAGGGLAMAMGSGVAGTPGHVDGPSGGQDDNVNARLSDGEYVMDADTVSNLGDGNNDAGARKLDEFRQNLRAHKRSAPPSKIPPKAKSPEKYLSKVKKSASSKAASIAMQGRR